MNSNFNENGGQQDKIGVVSHGGKIFIENLIVAPSSTLAETSTQNLSDSDNSIIDINSLVCEVRDKIYEDIQSRCGTMRVLDMTRPIGLCNIYTDVNILEIITGRRRLGISDLLKNFDPESDNFDRRGLGQVTEERLPGLQVVSQYPRLMVLGKPGAGKTTFLKYIALQSIWGKFQENRVPIFITLKAFSEDSNSSSLLSYIEQLFSEYNVTKNQIVKVLENGRAIVLFDGLDEVREEDSKRVLKEILNFSNKYFLSKAFKSDRTDFLSERNETMQEIENYRTTNEADYRNLELKRGGLKNSQEKLIKQLKQLESQFEDEGVITESKYKQESLKIRTEIEKLKEERSQLEPKFCKESDRIDENKKKIKEISLQFELEFPDISKHTDQGLEFLSRKFADKLYNNHFIVTCRIAAKEYTFDKFIEVEVADFDEQQIYTFSKNWFDLKDPLKSEQFIGKLIANQAIKELASNPLLLTLLCLIFGESNSFSSNRSQLYKEGISILLKKWDAERLIERAQIYQNLSPPRKEDLLSHIANITFERKDYFFKARDVESYISEYIRNLPDARIDLEALRLDSEAVLKSIEAQHGLLIERAKGIYSFSHLTFQEYFIARKIVTVSDPLALSEGLYLFVEHITERRWIEVFLLAVGMLANADYLLSLMKKKTDNLVSDDKNIQLFLAWTQEKSIKSNPSVDQLVAKAFYFAIYSDYKLAVSIARSRSRSNYRQLLSNLVSNLFLIDNCATEIISKVNGEISDIKSQSSHLLEMLDKAINLAQLLNRELVNGLDKTVKDFRTTNLNLAYALDPNLTHILAILLSTLDCENLETLRELKEQLPRLQLKDDKFRYHWNKNGRNWIKVLSQIISGYQSSSQDWKFNEEQRKLLRSYCDANKLIVDCLNSDCYISSEVRKEIENNLLSPSTSISKSLSQ